MWFKNLFLYRLPVDWTLSAAELEEKIAKKPLQQCGNQDKLCRGWISPTGTDALVHVLNGQFLIALGVEQKLLPASIINRFAKERASEIEEQEGRKVGRKEMRDIKEQVTEQLLPRAFAIQRSTRAWIDPLNHWLVVDAASQAKADEVLEVLSKTLDRLPAKLLQTQNAPSAAMTEWLAGKESPAGFSIDRDLDLSSKDDGKATVRYVRHDLEGDEIQTLIAAGKTATRLGMTWDEKISFVLTEQLQIKRLIFLDILTEEAENQSDNKEETFDINFTLMTGELAKLLPDLVQALGGEMVQ